MIKSSIIIIIVCCLFTCVSIPALAQGPEPPAPFDPELIRSVAEGSYNTEDTDESTLAKTLGRIVRAALSILGVIFVSLIVYGGYRWLLARGNTDEVEKAKAIMRNAIIGTFITAAAYGVWQVIQVYVL